MWLWTVWEAMWPNIFAPSAYTLLGITASHFALKRHVTRKHEETKRHVELRLAPPGETSRPIDEGEWTAELEAALRGYGVHVFVGNDGRKHLAGTGCLPDDGGIDGCD